MYGHQHRSSLAMALSASKDPWHPDDLFASELTYCITTRHEKHTCLRRVLMTRSSSLLESTRRNRLVRLVCEMTGSMEVLRSSQYSMIAISENQGWLEHKKNNGKPLATFYSSRLRRRDFSTLRRTPQMGVGLPKPALLRCSMLVINLRASLLL